MPTSVTVAIPTLNGGPGFEETLAAVRAQRLDRGVELLVCDSGSSDGTASLARRYDARVIVIPEAHFSHGGTRNLLMSEADGDHVAFLTQDAVPATEDWLGGLLSGFALARDVGLVFGPYRPRPEASLSVRRELTAWFDSFSDRDPRVDRLEPGQKHAPPQSFHGRLGFFTDANGCVARDAWEQVPFRDVAYAEDHLLAQDMLRAGFAKVYVPSAAVIHSHEYSTGEWVRRSFDESRAMRDVYGWVAGPRVLLRNLRGNVMADWRWVRRGSGASLRPAARRQLSVLTASLAHHGARSVGTLLGAHAGRLPASIVRAAVAGAP